MSDHRRHHRHPDHPEKEMMLQNTDDILGLIITSAAAAAAAPVEIEIVAVVAETRPS